MFKLVQYVARNLGKASGWHSTEMPFFVFNVLIISTWKFLITSDVNAAEVAIIHRLDP